MTTYYEFLERRFDQLNEWSSKDAEFMVDDLLNKNSIEFKRVNPSNKMVDEICLELWQELDAVANPDIPFRRKRES